MKISDKVEIKNDDKKRSKHELTTTMKKRILDNIRDNINQLNQNENFNFNFDNSSSAIDNYVYDNDNDNNIFEPLSDEDIIKLVNNNYDIPIEDKEDNDECIEEKIEQPLCVIKAKRSVSDLLKFVTTNNLEEHHYDSLVKLSERLQNIHLEKKQSKIDNFILKKN